MEDLNFDHLRSVAASGPTPLFATVSGAHLYGFPSPDSDVDLRGAFVLPVREVIRLREPVETLTVTRTAGGVEVDWLPMTCANCRPSYLFSSVERARQEALLNGAYSLSSVSSIKLSPAPGRVRSSSHEERVDGNRPSPIRSIAIMMRSLARLPPRRRLVATSGCDFRGERWHEVGS